MTATMRLATGTDVEELTRLKVEWAQLSTQPRPEDVECLKLELSAWLANPESCLCAVAELEEELVSMAWLILHPRVPDIYNLHRRTGDIQSVYVRPGNRGRGLGRETLKTLMGEAESRGINTLTVNSNSAARRLYEDLGFHSSDHHLTLD